jgi:hypothetical protein
MNSFNQPIINTQSEIFRRNLAEKLGITFDELTKLSYKLTVNQSKDGTFLNYDMEFGDNSPKDIMDKIEGVNPMHQLRLAQWEIDDDD